MTVIVNWVHRAHQMGTAGFISSQPDSLWPLCPYSMFKPKSESSLWIALSCTFNHPACRRWRVSQSSHAWPWGSLLVHGQCPAHSHGARVFLPLFRATWVTRRATASPGQCSQDERATTSPARPFPPPVQPPPAPSLLFPPKNQPPPIWVPRGPRGLILLLQRDAVSFSLFSTFKFGLGREPATYASSPSLPDGKQSKILFLCISLNFSSQGKLLIRLRPRHWLQWLHSLSFNPYKVPPCLLKVKPCFYLLSNVPEIFTIYSLNQYMLIEHLLSASSVLTAGDTLVNPKIKVPCPVELKYNHK